MIASLTSAALTSKCWRPYWLTYVIFLNIFTFLFKLDNIYNIIVFFILQLNTIIISFIFAYGIIYASRIRKQVEWINRILPPTDKIKSVNYTFMAYHPPILSIIFTDETKEQIKGIKNIYKYLGNLTLKLTENN